MKIIKTSNFFTIFIRPVCAASFTICGFLAIFTWFSDLEDKTKYIILLALALIFAFVVGWQIVLNYNELVIKYNALTKENAKIESINKNLNEIIKRKNSDLLNKDIELKNLNKLYSVLYYDFGQILATSITNSPDSEREKLEKIYQIYLYQSREFK